MGRLSQDLLLLLSLIAVVVVVEAVLDFAPSFFAITDPTIGQPVTRCFEVPSYVCALSREALEVFLLLSPFLFLPGSGHVPVRFDRELLVEQKYLVGAN